MRKYGIHIFATLFFMCWFIAGSAQDITLEGSSPVYNWDLSFRGIESDEIEFDLSDFVVKSKNYALIIGNSTYQDEAIQDLARPVKDANRFVDALLNYYTFEPDNIVILRDATQTQIIEALEELTKKVSSIDNVLIFYAGHGEWDSRLNIGYWLPSDAEKENRSTWFSNSILHDYVKAIRSKHTLIIADACFSGALFSSRSLGQGVPKAVEQLYNYKSRSAIVSGNFDQIVPDESVFLDYLISALRRNKDIYLPADRLFHRIREIVIDNSPNGQVPIKGPINGTGHEGGEFIFVRKR